MKKAIIYGAGQTGRRCYHDFKDEYDILYFVDSDAQKVGTLVLDKKVLPISEIDLTVDYIIIGTVYDNEKIIQQLIEKGFEPSRIVKNKKQIDVIPLFLRDFAHLVEKEEGQCAEVGVYRGDTARKINACFGNRQLHLFDTFSGFDQKDMRIEMNEKISYAQEGAFSDTSEDIVMSKMVYPDKITIHKGYFPETAVGIVDSFVFVRLDVDLYAPTLSGLKKFAPLMTENGIIMVHDYFTETYGGVKRAINEFCFEYPKKISKVPVGDGFSVVLTGF